MCGVKSSECGGARQCRAINFRRIVVLGMFAMGLYLAIFPLIMDSSVCAISYQNGDYSTSFGVSFREAKKKKLLSSYDPKKEGYETSYYRDVTGWNYVFYPAEEIWSFARGCVKLFVK